MAASRRSDPLVTKPKASHEVSAFQIASTILRSRPAYDTIALLIILLALPSMILTIFQAVFASLTLMPGGFSPFNFLSVFDVFQGSAGSPSLGVMLWVDMIFFGLWICLWNWAQNFALDLAQIHIAMTLGNGSSGKNGSANTICFAIVLCLHTARSQGVRRFVTSNLVPTNLLSQTRLADYLQYLPSELDFGETPGPPSKLRSFFAIHILSQALICFVRRRVASTQAAPNAKVSKRIESELFANSQDASGNDTAGASATATGHGLPSPIPGLRDVKEKGQTAKKRRRQANSVRSKQPFWAALASTKVHVMREVEHNRGLPSVTSTPNTPFDNSQQDAIWITNVEPSSIQFEANFIPKAISGDQESRLPEDSRPFYIRINGARWHSVSIEAIEDASESEGCPAQWSGEISGLAPNCTYTCSFIPWSKDQEFASVMVKTPALEDSDIATSLTPAPARQSTRPSSPTTTLKNSIASAETKLSEARKRLHQLKKSHRSSISKVEKDVDTLNGKLRSGADNTTTKLQQKLLQAERNAQQHKDAKYSTQSAIDTLKAIPEDDAEEHNQRQEAYQTQKALLAEANESLVKAKSEADNDLACIGGELSTIASRKERILARQAKLNEQHDRITQANAQGLNEKERREADSIRREADAARREVEMQNHISHMSQQIRDLQLRTQSNWHEIDMLEKQDMAQRQKMMLSTGPVTPEGDLPGTRPQPQSARQFAFGSVNVPPGHAGLEPSQSSPFLAYANTLPSDGRRPRSDTNRSAAAMSNFSADFDDADPIPPMPVDFEVNGRKGSGSSRGKNNGSPAGVIGGGLRSPQRGSHSPGHLPGSTTW
jgi:ubiquitination network signaling protein AcrB